MRDGMASHWADKASAIINVANTDTGNTEHRSVIAWGFRSEGGLQPLTLTPPDHLGSVSPPRNRLKMQDG